MSTVNDEPLMDREEGRKLYQESEKLLRLAEELQDKCEQYERRVWMLLLIGATLIVLLLMFSNYLVSAFPPDSVYRTLVTFLPYLYFSATGASLTYMYARIRRQAVRERRALHSIVDMLRGLEKGIAEKNNLSTLERAEFRIRLSRFDIGPG
jgi:uncharacterized membrane protein